MKKAAQLMSKQTKGSYQHWPGFSNILVLSYIISFLLQMF
jgi:hypothetical protein